MKARSHALDVIRPLIISFIVLLLKHAAWGITITGPLTANNVSVTGGVAIDTITVSSATFQNLLITTGTYPSSWILGTTTNDNAPAGHLGEYIESFVNSTKFSTSTVWGDLTSISISPGDWDMSACGGQDVAVSTNTTWLQLAISTTSGTGSGDITNSNLVETNTTATTTNPETLCIAAYRISSPITTSVYFKGRSNYETWGSTPTASGRISARRVR